MDVAERMHNLPFAKQRLLRLMKKLGFDLSYEKRGKHTCWRFAYDQGVFKGANVYECMQHDLAPISMIQILIAEGFTFNRGLEEAIAETFWAYFKDREE